MEERILAPGMRILLFFLGTVAIGAAAAVGTTRLRGLGNGAPVVPTVLGAAICVLVALGGLRLLRGAFRGRIMVRRPRHRAPLV